MSEQEIELQKKIWWSVHKEDHEICERLQDRTIISRFYKRWAFIPALGNKCSSISKTYNKFNHERKKKCPKKQIVTVIG